MTPPRQQQLGQGTGLSPHADAGRGSAFAFQQLETSWTLDVDPGTGRRAAAPSAREGTSPGNTQESPSSTSQLRSPPPPPGEEEQAPCPQDPQPAAAPARPPAAGRKSSISRTYFKAANKEAISSEGLIAGNPASPEIKPQFPRVQGAGSPAWSRIQGKLQNKSRAAMGEKRRFGNLDI